MVILLWKWNHEKLLSGLARCMAISLHLWWQWIIMAISLHLWWQWIIMAISLHLWWQWIIFFVRRPRWYIHHHKLSDIATQHAHSGSYAKGNVEIVMEIHCDISACSQFHCEITMNTVACDIIPLSYILLHGTMTYSHSRLTFTLTLHNTIK